jgi:PAS domain-containing protein
LSLVQQIGNTKGAREDRINEQSLIRGKWRATPKERAAAGGEGHAAASLLLDDQGMIRDCDGRGEALYGYSLRELVCAHVSKLLPRLRGVELVQDGVLNPQLDQLCHCGHVFRVHGRHGAVFPSELIFVRLGDVGALMHRLFILPAASASC